MNSRIEVSEITPEMRLYVVMAALEKLGLAETDVTRDDIIRLIIDDKRKPNNRFDVLSAFEYKELLGHFGIDLDWIRRRRERIAQEQDSILAIISACSIRATELLKGGLDVNRNSKLKLWSS